MKKEKRLKELEESYHTGIMNKEEYLKKKKKIELLLFQILRIKNLKNI